MWLVNLRMATLFHQVMMISCSKESVYGKRDGAVHGLVITHRDDRNVIRNTQGWKTGVVLGIRMLPRHEMWKPEAVPRNVMNITKYSFLVCDVYHPTLVLSVAAVILSKASPGRGLPHLGRAMTMVQELKQAPGTGLDLGFCPSVPPKKVPCTRLWKNNLGWLEKWPCILTCHLNNGRKTHRLNAYAFVCQRGMCSQKADYPSHAQAVTPQSKKELKKFLFGYGPTRTAA